MSIFYQFDDVFLKKRNNFSFLISLFELFFPSLALFVLQLDLLEFVHGISLQK